MRRLLLALTMFVAACSSADRPPQKPLTFKINRDGRSVPGTVLNLAVDIHGGQRDGELVATAGKALKKIGTDLITGHSPVQGEFSDLNIVFLSDNPAPDSAAGRKFLHISIRDQELRQMTHFGANEDTLLGSATEAGWWTPSNDEVVNDYCRTRSESQFCRKFVRE